MSKDFEFQTKMYESLRKAAGVRETPEDRTLIIEVDQEYNDDGYSYLDIVFHEVYRTPKTGNGYEDGCRGKIYEFVGRLEVGSLAELFHEMAEAAGEDKENGN